MNKSLILILILVAIQYKAFAVKGKNIVNFAEVEKASCKLEIAYDDLKGERGTCSGVSIGEGRILTAKHCLYHSPTLMPRGEKDPIKSPFKEKDYISMSKININCNGQNFKALELRSHPHTDLATIKIDGVVLNNLMINTKNEVDEIVKKNNTCYAFGFGFNNEKKMGKFNGVKITDFKAYTQEEAFLEIEMDADFKAMSFSFANSMFGSIFMNKSFFPRLVTYSKEDNLEVLLVGFKNLLTQEGMKENDLFNPEFGPKFKEFFFSYFQKAYAKAYKGQMIKVQKRAVKKNLSPYRYILNTDNSTGEKAGIDYGDSGGSFVCEFDGEFKLAGINSRILTDSNLGYTSKPWEPMNFRPKKRQTKNGEVIPVTKDILVFLK